MKPRKHRQLFYPIGIISITLLPILGFYKISSIYKERTQLQHVLQLNTCCYSVQMEIKIRKARKFKSFLLSSDSISNILILNNARHELNGIKDRHDTINGVRIIFSDSTKYQDFVKALDFCYEKWPPTFSPTGNDILAFYAYLDTATKNSLTYQ